MAPSEIQILIRPMTLTDINRIFTIHQRITEADTSATYRGFSAKRIFGIDKEATDTAKRQQILEEVAKFVDLGFVAESEGAECGFIVGRQTYQAEYDIQEGEIAMIGVDPNYRGKGIGTKLLNALCDLFQSRGVQRVRVGIDPVDKELTDFFEHEGFSGQRIIYYSKML